MENLDLALADFDCAVTSLRVQDETAANTTALAAALYQVRPPPAVGHGTNAVMCFGHFSR